MKMARILTALLISAGLATLGCEGDVSTTDDATRIEAEGPVVETGDAETDLDPTTDDDVDIDTPLEGDT